MFAKCTNIQIYNYLNFKCFINQFNLPARKYQVVLGASTKKEKAGLKNTGQCVKNINWLQQANIN